MEAEAVPTVAQTAEEPVIKGECAVLCCPDAQLLFSCVR